MHNWLTMLPYIWLLTKKTPNTLQLREPAYKNNLYHSIIFINHVKHTVLSEY